MKRLILIATSAAAAFSIATTPAFAQHGRPAGSMGGTHSSGSTHSGSENEANSGSNSGALSGGALNPNSKLAVNLRELLPTGIRPQDVCANFTHLGPCVAAIHVSHNLGIDINSLVCDMTLKAIGSTTACPKGTGTGTKEMSLGRAIQALDPDADSKSESKKANEEAKQDIKDSNS